MRAAGMGVSGLEPSQHRLLPVLGRAAHGRVDGVPPDRGDLGSVGAGIGSAALFFEYSCAGFERFSTERA